MTNVYDIINKMEAIYNSCETFEQFNMAKSWADKALRYVYKQYVYDIISADEYIVFEVNEPDLRVKTRNRLIRNTKISAVIDKLNMMWSYET